VVSLNQDLVDIETNNWTGHTSRNGDNNQGDGNNQIIYKLHTPFTWRPEATVKSIHKKMAVKKHTVNYD